MKTSDFDYHLPPEMIAQTPCEPRDHSRLMVVNRTDCSIEHRRFFQIVDYLREGDVLVLNESRVIPARLAGRRANSGGKVEILLLRCHDAHTWEALVKPGKQLHVGDKVEMLGGPASEMPEAGGVARIVEDREDGVKLIEFSDSRVAELGQVPLPPYIRQPLADAERYQTVYARVTGSVAAPTAGLHFTRELLRRIEQKGASCHFVTLHISLDTFRPIREEDPRQHAIFKEYGVLGQEAADQLAKARREGRRIICVGTTSVRIVEHAAQASAAGQLQPFEGWADLFILPGYQFRMTDALVTNFHLPRSSLLMLVSAFTGEELIKKAYQEAINSGYRFYSFGDAMLVI